MKISFRMEGRKEVVNAKVGPWLKSFDKLVALEDFP